MAKFEFMLGDWNLEYNIPKSRLAKEDRGTGQGSIKRILDGKYVTFDYESIFSDSSGKAHGIFARDEKWEVYRYWWFENSGSHMSAVCEFMNDTTLRIHWDNTMLVQNFMKITDSKMILEMGFPLPNHEFDRVMEVIMTRC